MSARRSTPAASVATSVWRQNRRAPYSAGTRIVRSGWDSSLMAPKICPISGSSGRPPSDGGLNRGSRQVPVHSGDGSSLAPASVSL